MIHSLQFRQKIWLLPFSAATVFAVGVAVSFFVGAGTSASLRYLETVASPTHSLVQKVDGGIESIRLMLQTAVAEGDVEKVDEVQVAVDKTRSLIKELATIAASRPLADRLSRGFEQYQGTALGATRAMLSKGDFGDQIKGMRLAQQALHQEMETATRESAAAVAESQQAAGRGTRLAQWTSLATGLVTLLVLGIASVAVVRSVWQDLGEEPGKLKDLVREIASGNLTVAPAIVEGDTRSLNSALGQMLHQLRDAVTTIHLAADSIGTSSAEIAQGSADLSHRTEAAASNLQLTASSVEGLTGSVQQSSLAASQANGLAVTAATAAKNGGEIMTQVVTNMTEIDVASRRIAEIIGVIDGIAFQTNILALNAAVEAARAGDQGRGFAVVAGEVRSLARRSAESAREIRDLIGGSVEKVAFGTRLVGSAGSAMQDIVGSVSRVSSVVGEISCSAQLQSNGIGQVNHAVMALDKMTQQNAALVEQSTAAAESMREQSVRLTEAVARFRVPELAVLAHCA